MSKKINRTDEIKKNNQGLRMTIIAYRSCNDIDIQFEDGTIVEHKRYDKFTQGKIAYPYKKRIGETKKNNQGLIMTIINYKGAKDIDVQFEDGTIVENRAYSDFKSGNIAHPTECSDSISIPNKMLRQISEQLGLNWQFEHMEDWLGQKRLDAYDNNLKIAIEMDAEYKDNHKGERKEVDDWKDKQCLRHKIYVIRIDLMNTREYNKDTFEYIKRQILNSPLTLIYDFSDFNWELAWENSLKSLVWKVKGLYEEGYMDKEIAEILGIGINAILNYKRQLGIKTRSEIKQENLLKTKELIQQGKSIKEISRILDKCESIIYRYVKELKIELINIQKITHQENLLKTKELIQQGKTNKQITEILNISKSTVKKYKRELNFYNQ